jgi:hypothetical protein
MRHSSLTRNRATPGSKHLLGAQRLCCFEAVDYPFRLPAFEESRYAFEPERQFAEETVYSVTLQQRIKAMRGSRGDPRYRSQVRPSPTGSRTKRGDRGDGFSQPPSGPNYPPLAWPPLKGEPFIRGRLIDGTNLYGTGGVLARSLCGPAGRHFGSGAPALWEETESQRAGAA